MNSGSALDIADIRLAVGLGSFNPEPAATAKDRGNAVAAGSGLNEVRKCAILNRARHRWPSQHLIACHRCPGGSKIGQAGQASLIPVVHVLTCVVARSGSHTPRRPLASRALRRPREGPRLRSTRFFATLLE